MDPLLALFRFGISPLELLVRGTAMFWFLFLLFRFVLRRDAGSMGMADILLLVLVADASQNAMAGAYGTISEGMFLVATLTAWSWFIDCLSFRSKAFRRIAEPPPLVLVRRGLIVSRNLRREYITVPELLAGLRAQGIDKLADVKVARMEADGSISAIRQRPPTRVVG